MLPQQLTSFLVLCWCLSALKSVDVVRTQQMDLMTHSVCVDALGIVYSEKVSYLKVRKWSSLTMQLIVGFILSSDVSLLAVVSRVQTSQKQCLLSRSSTENRFVLRGILRRLASNVPLIRVKDLGRGELPGALCVINSAQPCLHCSTWLPRKRKHVWNLQEFALPSEAPLTPLSPSRTLELFTPVLERPTHRHHT